MLSLFGSSVLSAVGTNDGTLTLVFDNGEKLIFLDTSNTYESYFIEHDGNSTIV